MYLLPPPALIIGPKKSDIVSQKQTCRSFASKQSSGNSAVSRTSNTLPHAIYLFFADAECLVSASCNTLLASMLFLGTPWWMPCFARPYLFSMSGMRSEVLGLCIPNGDQVWIHSENIFKAGHISTLAMSSTAQQTSIFTRPSSRQQH